MTMYELKYTLDIALDSSWTTLEIE